MSSEYCSRKGRSAWVEAGRKKRAGSRGKEDEETETGGQKVPTSHLYFWHCSFPCYIIRKNVIQLNLSIPRWKRAAKMNAPVWAENVCLLGRKCPLL